MYVPIKLILKGISGITHEDNPITQLRYFIG